MSLRIIYGPGGAGKSHYIYEECIKRSLEHPERMFYILVPEQSTLSTQQHLLALHPGHGSVNIDVIGFTTLAYRVIEQLHIPTKKMIDDSGKMLLMRRAVRNVSNDLKILKCDSEKPGFLDNVVHTLGEMASFGLFEEGSSLQALLEAPEGSGLSDHYILQQKLSDLALIWKSYRREIEDRFMDKDELMPILCKALPEFAKQVPFEIYLDGFNGFTPLQYNVITHLMLNAERVSVALCAKKGTLVGTKEGDLFDSAATIYKKLMDSAQRDQIAVEPDLSIGEEFVYRLRENDELSHLERVYEQQVKPAPWKHACESIRLYRLDHPTMEVSMIVRTIRDLVYREGYRFSDIAVVTGKADRFRDIIVREFERAQIPYFSDMTRDMTDSDYTNFVLSLFGLLTYNFQKESVLSSLKYGYVIPDEDLDRLENYVIARGINSYKRFVKFAEEEKDDEIRRIMGDVLAVYGPFYERFRKGKHTAAEYLDGIAEVMNACKAAQTVQNRIDFLNDDGRYDRAAEYEAVQEKMQNLFAQTQSLMADDLMRPDELEELLKAGLEDMKIGVIPPTLDRVIIGELRRMRIGKIKTLFMLGVNEGLFPLVEQGSGLINDSDRDILRELSVELSPSASRDSMNDKLYLYQMFTTPSKRLYLSYSTMDSKGEALLPSYVIEQIRAIFENLHEEKKLPKDNQALLNPHYCIDLISQKKDAFGLYYRALYQWYKEDPKYAKLLSELQLLREFKYVHTPLPEAIAVDLFERNHSISPSRLESYGCCAFRHFLSYGLGLEERKEAAIDALDRGSFYHAALQYILEEMSADRAGASFEWTAKRRDDLVKRALTFAYKQDDLLKDKMEDNGYNQYLSRVWEKEIAFLVDVIRVQIDSGDFKNFRCEVPFGKLPDEDGPSKPHMNALKIPGTDCEIRGKVDRIDETEDGSVVRIIDYKTGYKELDYSLLSEGAQLQLPIYLTAVMNDRLAKGTEIQPAGVYYFHAEQPLIPVDSDQMEKHDEDRDLFVWGNLLMNSRMHGLTNREKEVFAHQEPELGPQEKSILIDGISLLKSGEFGANAQVFTNEEFVRFSDSMMNKIAELYKDMMGGQIPVNPLKSSKADACGYCPYKAICHIKDKRNDLKPRKVKSLNFKDYREILRRENDQEKGE
ncbi:MAG: exodeoxyribonuclease V subunit gamma [Lachnospiraceae bacterium]|nr:exodeoxyribonuclease V subunit gamma [Lachnospiraceae bacterium]